MARCFAEKLERGVDVFDDSANTANMTSLLRREPEPGALHQCRSNSCVRLRHRRPAMPIVPEPKSVVRREGRVRQELS